MEPYITLRGHTGPILTLGAAMEQGSNVHQANIDSMLFSGGVNGNIHIWRVPESRQVQPYGAVMDN